MDLFVLVVRIQLGLEKVLVEWGLVSDLGLMVQVEEEADLLVVELIAALDLIWNLVQPE